MLFGLFLRWCQNLVLMVLSEFLPHNQIRHARVGLSPLTLHSFPSHPKSYSTFCPWVPCYLFSTPNSQSFSSPRFSILPYPRASFSSQTWVLRGFMLPKQNVCSGLPNFFPLTSLPISSNLLYVHFLALSLCTAAKSTLTSPTGADHCPVWKTPKCSQCSPPKQHPRICFWHGFQRF